MFDGPDIPGFVVDLSTSPFIKRLPWAAVCHLTRFTSEIPGHKTVSHSWGIYLFCWFRAGFSDKPATRLKGKAFRELGIVNRMDKLRALALLERSGLVRVKREGNRAPVVILLQPESLRKGNTTSAQNGYGRRWREFRAEYLCEHPDCACNRPAVIVDHVNGRSDDILEGPFQAMCRSCHGRKSARERWNRNKSRVMD